MGNIKSRLRDGYFCSKPHLCLIYLYIVDSQVFPQHKNTKNTVQSKEDSKKFYIGAFGLLRRKQITMMYREHLHCEGDSLKQPGNFLSVCV
jgi:hypothetical protein